MTQAQLDLTLYRVFAEVTALAVAGCTIGLGRDGFTQVLRPDLSLLPLLWRQEQRDPNRQPPRSVVSLGRDGS